MKSNERIAVTGVGLVSALGPDATSTFRRLIAGEQGFGPVKLFDVEGQRTQIAAEISGLRVSDVAPPGQAEAWSRSDALGVLAAREALASARLKSGTAISIAVGASTGGMYEAEAVLGSMRREGASDASARRLLAYPLSTTAERIAEAVGGVERIVTLCSACSSGANAIAQAAAWIRSGQARSVLAGGADGLCSLTFTGFNSLGAMDVDPCRPFDAKRAGMSLGEGAGFLLLELESVARARGAKIHAWLSGWAIGAEAHHITHPEPSGAVAARLLSQSLWRASLQPSDVDYVNAHGTGTPQNDAMEARALRAAFGAEVERIRVSSSKGQLGHTLGAAGAIEAAITVLAVEQGMSPPTGGLQTPELELGLRHVMARGEELRIRAALSSSFGFGGSGCVLAFEQHQAPLRDSRETGRSRLVISGAASMGPLGMLSGEANAAYAESSSEPREVGSRLELDPLTRLDPARSRRFDRGAAMVTAGAEQALADAGLEAEGVGLVSGTAFGSLERSVEFLRRVSERGPRFASPAEFPHLVPSAPAGNASIYLRLMGPVVSVADLATSGEAAAAVAAGFVELGLATAMLAGSAEPYDAIVARVLDPLHGARGPEPRSEGGAWVLIEAEQAAQARGKRPLAAVIARAQRWGDPGLSFAEIGPPGVPLERALVVMAVSDETLDGALAGSGWAHAARRRVGKRAGTHEALGALALATGAALVARGDADEVLCLGGGHGRSYLVRLGRALPVADR